MQKFTEASLEQAIIDLMTDQGYPHVSGDAIERELHDVLIKEDLRDFLRRQYAAENITANEIDTVMSKIELLPAGDLYDSNKTFMRWVSSGFLLKREDHTQKDLYIQLLDYSSLTAMRTDKHLPEQIGPVADSPEQYDSDAGNNNIIKLVNQLEITGERSGEKRIPDAIVYINGLPLVVCEFKSTIRENTTIEEAYTQLTVRYRRSIPELFVFNAFCVISDGSNSKMGSVFAKYEFYYAWRKVTGDETVERAGIESLYTMIEGLFNPHRLLEVIRHFIFFPDKSNDEQKIICRYPQYYAATKLYDNIRLHRKPEGDGKGGTYFGTTGCGKSYTMLFLARLLMKSVEFASPTIVVITDRTDLDDQLSRQFENASDYIGDKLVVSVTSRDDLRAKLKGRNSGGVFLTTIHKFNEDTELLTERNNVICISDEAHRSQINLQQKITIDEKSGKVKKSYGFAKHLHDSLPNATYVGFTGTPIDATLAVFGDPVDSYTMTESVYDEITVPLVYEGRAAKVLLESSRLKEIEEYYDECADDGASEYQIEESKKAMASMRAILGDPDRIKAIAEDFVHHYETRLEEGSTVKGKAMFVCTSRQIAYLFYQEVIKLRPAWAEVKACEDGAEISAEEKKKLKPLEHIKMIMTRGKDDPEELYDALGTKEYRKELDRQFKNGKSNFKIAVLVDMWLTGFDVPFLDTIYIDKPIARHNLIQTISRVNRTFEGKEKGLVVDYIGIKKQMNLALAQYGNKSGQNIEEIEASVVVVKNHLELLDGMFHTFDAAGYYTGKPVEQLNCLNKAAEFAQTTEKQEKRFMMLVKRLKLAYDICCGSESLSESERDKVHFYCAVRSIIFKLNKGSAPDTAQMNAKVTAMIAEAIKSEGVEEIFKLGEDQGAELDLFSDDYLEKIEKIKLPNTKIKLLQQLLKRAISDFKKTNRAKGMDFSKKFQALVEKYNERDEDSVLVANVLDDFADSIVELLASLKIEKESYSDLGIGFEEKAFYDILLHLAQKYDFSYPEEKLLPLAKEVKKVVDDKAKYTDWDQREDIKAELKVDLIMLLADFGYPPIDRDEVYQEIFKQAENFKKNS